MEKDELLLERERWIDNDTECNEVWACGYAMHLIFKEEIPENEMKEILKELKKDVDREKEYKLRRFAYWGWNGENETKHIYLFIVAIPQISPYELKNIIMQKLKKVGLNTEIQASFIHTDMEDDWGEKVKEWVKAKV